MVKSEYKRSGNGSWILETCVVKGYLDQLAAFSILYPAHLEDERIVVHSRVQYKAVTRSLRHIRRRKHLFDLV
jgi:hypothetical protein